MKRAIILTLLLAISVFIGYMLVKSVQSPIEFQNEYEKRTDAVIEALLANREAQEAFRSVHKGYCPTYDSLKQTLAQDSFTLVATFGDIDAGEEVTTKITKVSVVDSLANKGVKLDSLEFIPYGKGETFKLSADTLTFQKVLVPVVHVRTTVDKYMADYFEGASEDKKEEILTRLQMYDKTFDPDEVIGFGSMLKPSTSGSWDK